jgi:hypothetical protein
MSTLFDFSSDSPHSTQASQLDEMESDAERLQSHISARRRLLQQQARADEIKAQLCDELRAEKMAVPDLDRRVRALEIKDPEMYKYIRKLEFVQEGIWCPSCHVIKNVGIPRPVESIEQPIDSKSNEDSKSTVDYPAENAIRAPLLDDTQQKLEEIKAEYDILANNVTAVTAQLMKMEENNARRYAEGNRVIGQLKAALIDLCDRAAFLGVQMDSYENETGEDYDEPDESVDNSGNNSCEELHEELYEVSQVATPPKTPLSMMSKCSLQELLAKKLATISADDLLR